MNSPYWSASAQFPAVQPPKEINLHLEAKIILNGHSIAEEACGHLLENDVIVTSAISRDPEREDQVSLERELLPSAPSICVSLQDDASGVVEV
jgi:hypothetical protein